MQLSELMSRATDEGARKWLWLAVFTFLVGIFFVFSSEVVEAEAGQAELVGVLDKKLLLLLRGMRSPRLNSVAVDITAMGSGTVLLILICIASLCFVFLKKTSHAGILCASGGCSAIATAVLKTYFERSRPDITYRVVEVQGYSYPSGHSLASASIYMMLAILLSGYLQSRIQKLILMSVFLFLVLTIGVTRMYLGVHYFSDVTAGILLGTAIASLLGAINSSFHFDRNRS